MNIDDSRQRMLGIGAPLDSDSENGFRLFDRDPEVSVMIGHDQSTVLLSPLGHLASGETLGAVVSSRRSTGSRGPGRTASGSSLFQQLGLLHVEASRQLVREFLNRTEIKIILSRITGFPRAGALNGFSPVLSAYY